jgi:hypothetical protein
MIKKVCKMCSFKFAVIDSREKQKFCSRGCADRNKREKGEFINSCKHPWKATRPHSEAI